MEEELRRQRYIGGIFLKVGRAGSKILRLKKRIHGYKALH
jgi:hypothetical protein